MQNFNNNFYTIFEVTFIKVSMPIVYWEKDNFREAFYSKLESISTTRN